MRIGLIGLGDVAKYHTKAIEYHGLELIAVSDADKSRNPNIPGAEFYQNYKGMLGKDIDAVAIATPNYLHAPMTIDALCAGKNVLVEKPMTTNLEDAQRMIDAAKANGKILVVSYHFQFVPEVQHFLQTKGQYGNIKLFESYFVGPMHGNRPWLYKKEESGGGMWMDNGVNVISVLKLFIPDLKVREAVFEYGSRDKIQDQLVEDCAEVKLGNDNISGNAVLKWRNGELVIRTRFETEKDEIILDHVAHKIIHNGVEVFSGEDMRYMGVYKDFIVRANSGSSNAHEALQDLKLVLDAYSKGN